MTVKYETPRCRECGNTSIVEVDEDKLLAWRRREKLIHEAFPEMTAEEREVIMTGTHPSCWNKMFAHPYEEWIDMEGVAQCFLCDHEKEHEIHTPDENEATFDFIMSLRNN